MHVTVDAEPLAEQLPVPFHSTRGFERASTGVVNSARETASIRIAESNAPSIRATVPIEFRIHVDGRRVERLETTV